MRLTRLLLHNYRQHKDRDLDLDGYIVGVIGPNGSGKSNLMGSLHYAFSGEQPGAKKSELLRWGAAEGFVELQFTHANQKGIIRRSLHSNHTAMQYGNDTHTGINNVNSMIEQLFGLDKDLLRQTIFVRQAEIDSVLFTDPRVRELAFQRLCGIGDAAKVHKRLGELISTMEVPQDFDAQIADGIQRRAEMETRMQAMNKQLADMPKLPDVQAMQQQAYTLRDARVTAQNLLALYYTVHKTEDQQKQLAAGLATIVLPTADIQDMDKRIGELYQLVNAAEHYAQAYRAYEEANRAVAELGSAPEPTPLPFTVEQLADLKKKAEDYTARYGAARSNMAVYQELAKVVALMKTAECPVCGGPIKDAGRLNKMIAQFETEAKAVDPGAIRLQVATMFEQNQMADSQNKQRQRSYEAVRVERAKQLANATAACQSVQRVEKSADDLRAAVVELSTARKQLVDAQMEHTRLSGLLSGVKDSLVRLYADRDQLIAKLKAYYPDPQETDLPAYDTAFSAQINKLNAGIQEVQKLAEQYASLRGMLQELEQSLRTLDKTIDVLKQRRADQAIKKEVAGTLTAVRDWFHYLNGPHTITASVLQEMTVDVNRFLTYFSAPFIVQPAGEVMGFRVQFIDDRDKPTELPDATILSGGQKVTLAIAFRFASYCIFANKQGLLSLDEPTVYLDDRSISCFCTLLEKIKDIAKQMSLQVIIATHERATMPFMDKIIDLDA